MQFLLKAVIVNFVWSWSFAGVVSWRSGLAFQMSFQKSNVATRLSILKFDGLMLDLLQFWTSWFRAVGVKDDRGDVAFVANTQVGGVALASWKSSPERHPGFRLVSPANSVIWTPPGNSAPQRLWFFWPWWSVPLIRVSSGHFDKESEVIIRFLKKKSWKIRLIRDFTACDLGQRNNIYLDSLSHRDLLKKFEVHKYCHEATDKTWTSWSMLKNIGSYTQEVQKLWHKIKNSFYQLVLLCNAFSLV